eukprot:746962-Hanusia_phi.AAC.1
MDPKVILMLYPLTQTHPTVSDGNLLLPEEKYPHTARVGGYRTSDATGSKGWGGRSSKRISWGGVGWGVINSDPPTFLYLLDSSVPSVIRSVTDSVHWAPTPTSRARCYASPLSAAETVLVI